ncbi:MAG: hypothetical protein COB83_07985 [Gammaproteobacteria bacterium]|nr:MAG: hypothetical protein COB83_07985 [Gammaproteobacteria bacterium]
MKSSNINPVKAYFLTINSKATIQSSHFRLKAFCLFTFSQADFDKCDWSALDYIKILTYMKHQKSLNLAFSSVNVTLSILKSVAMQAWQLSIINIENYMRIKTIRGIKGARVNKGFALSVDDVHLIKRNSDKCKRLVSRRNFAIFAVACGAGLRRVELARLNIENIQDDKLVIIGKNNKERAVYLSPFVKKALNDWLKVLNSEIGALFVRIFASGEMGERVGLLSVHRAIERIQENSGLPRFTTHDLRRTFATTLLDANADKFAVQRLLGHTSLNTTERYDRRGDRAAKAAIELLPF